MSIFKFPFIKKINVLIFILAFTWNSMFGQSKDSTTYYINKLNWESFRTIPQYATFDISFDENARKLISMHNKKTIDNLLPFINQRDKAVAIHAILTKIYEQQKLSVSARYIYKKVNGKDVYSEMISMALSTNNLTWYINFNGNNPPTDSISTNELMKIKKYWMDKKRRDFNNPKFKQIRNRNSEIRNPKDQ